jgi:CheY-like chemotaxis protein
MRAQSRGRIQGQDPPHCHCCYLGFFGLSFLRLVTNLWPRPPESVSRCHATTFVKGHILYTEDDPDSRDLILKQNGYQVTCTENGTEALSLAKNQHFDLFLVDNWLPGLTGPDLTRYIREFNQTTPDNPFIESFNGSFRDECLNVNWFLSLEDAKEKIQLFKEEYNGFRPHSSLSV